MQDSICVKEVNGIKIAILNYTYGTNGISMPSDMPYAVNLLDKEKIARDIELAKTQSDFIVVCPHWGIEYTNEFNSEQEEMAKYMTRLGANLIIGTHPHVIQPVKWVTADNGNSALVYYSLGNFVNFTSDAGKGVANRAVRAMANVTLTKENDTVKISDYSVIPLVSQMIIGTGKVTSYKISDYNSELASDNEMTKKDSEFSYDYCVNLCRQIFGTEVRIDGID